MQDVKVGCEVIYLFIYIFIFTSVHLPELWPAGSGVEEGGT